MLNEKQGFTLIELLVVVLIIGILSAMAMPQYFKAVERARMSEAETLLANIAQAQRRKFLQSNKYVRNFSALDVSPKGATGSTYFTKGNPVTGNGGNGFEILLIGEQPFTEGYANATRMDKDSSGNQSSLQYDYFLSRYYQSDYTLCVAANKGGADLCADFCGVDESIGWVEGCCNNGQKAGDIWGYGTPCKPSNN